MVKGEGIDKDDVQFSSYSIKQIAREAGVERMSDEAARRIAFEQEREIQSIVNAAQVIAEAAGRKTVKEEDVLRVKTIVQEVQNG